MLIMDDSRDDQRVVVGGIDVVHQFVQKSRNVNVLRRDILWPPSNGIVYGKQHARRSSTSQSNLFFRGTFFHQCLHFQKKLLGERLLFLQLLFQQVKGQKIVSYFLLRLQKMLMFVPLHDLVCLRFRQRICLDFIGGIGTLFL